jgi:ADP-ribosylglycohydrolase
MIPSYVLAGMIYYILNNNMNIKDSLYKSIDDLKEWNKFKDEDVNYFINLIDKSVELSESNMNDIDAIRELGEGWVAEEALAIAVYSCLKYSNSFEDVVVCAVNHDGDSDSTGAIAGNIIGVYLGLDSIPSYYVDNLELKDVILKISRQLLFEED